MNETKAGAAAETKKRSLAELGAALREAREGRNMSLDDLAAATCIRRNYLEDIEAGCFELRLHVIAILIPSLQSPRRHGNTDLILFSTLCLRCLC